MTDIYTPRGHVADRPQVWGTEFEHTAFGYSVAPKQLWHRQVTRYQDIAALERFGIDPTRPAGHGIITQANSMGYPIDGFTTGYTVKLAPPCDPVAAQRTPRSGLAPSVIASSDNSDPYAAVPLKSDEPLQQPGSWQYPERQAANLAAGSRELRQQDAIFAATYGEDALHRKQAREWGPPATGVNARRQGVAPFGG